MALNQIRKRDGRLVPFNDVKITDAIYSANKACGIDDRTLAITLTAKVLGKLNEKFGSSICTVEDIQDMVEQVLIEEDLARTAKAYILYRDKRNRVRIAKSDLMDAVEEILIETSKENANVGNSPSAKMLQIASAASRT